MYLLSQLRHFVDTPKRKLFHLAHVFPHLTYASTVWDGCSDIILNKLNSLHRRAAKLMISDFLFCFNNRYKATVLGTISAQRKAYVQ